jgi:hypothetical protein
VNVTDVARLIVGDGFNNNLLGTSENDTILGLGGNTLTDCRSRHAHRRNRRRQVRVRVRCAGGCARGILIASPITIRGKATRSISALLAAAIAGGQQYSALVRLVEPSSTFSNLKRSTDGTANGQHFVTIARLGGVHPATGEHHR